MTEEGLGVERKGSRGVGGCGEKMAAEGQARLSPDNGWGPGCLYLLAGRVFFSAHQLHQ